MSRLFTKAFWIETVDRAVKSAAQAVLLVWGVGEVAVPDAFSMDYKLAMGSALGGALLSVLTSIASAGIGTPGTPTALPVDRGAPDLEP